MGNQQLKKTMNGAVILTIAAFVAKVLSAVYRVPFQNMVGNTGFYVYQQVYPLYGLGMTLALNGLPVFLSKIIAETPTPEMQRKVQQKLFVLLAAFSLGIFLALYFGANVIAEGMGDRQLNGIIQAVSWQFLLVPFLSVSRGYFQGTFQMIPTAVSQVVEQVVRVAVILLVAYTYNASFESVYQMGADAMSSAWIAAIAASMTMAIFIVSHYKNRPFSAEIHPDSDPVPTYQKLLKRLGTEGLVLCLLSAMLLLLQLVDSFTLYNGLIQSGVEPESARNLKGIYDRGQPLVQLGMVVATAFSSSLLPMLTVSVVEKKTADFIHIAKSFLRITITIATAATFGMILLTPYLNHTLFGDKEGNLTIGIYLIAIFLASLIGAVNAIFQSRNQHRLAFVGLMIGLLVKALVNTYLVELRGTAGSSLGTVLALLATLVFSWLKLDGQLKTAVYAKGFCWKLVVSSIMMGVTVIVVTSLIHLTGLDASRTGSFVVAILGVGIGVAVFVKAIISVKLLTLREWLSLPFGKRVLRK
ncbi:polysaccharide biosynthesis protein [Desemzia sp. RIT804]|uniref:polysaccharide biosynthesis protein n=1 Tax=Desemzia sp. RIT 804 TaxID=2810209 RepID=UPI00194E99FF|nr:polysaccharide biosynthesis protein [Desemzia sp. RIT 804]MBM6615390.1 polysaccharide biosynthesis protein [Desemzia sp. RIT 804]